MSDEKPMTCPSARIDKANTVRAARLLDPEFFPALTDDNRKVAVLTLERGFVPMLVGAQRGVDAICDMCRDSNGERYNPAFCTKRCKMFRAHEKMEELQTALVAALRVFHKPENDGDDNGGHVPSKPKKGPKKGNGKGDPPEIVFV